MKQEFTVGVFALISKHHDYAENKEVETITYSVHEWCTDSGVAYYRKEGEILVEKHVFTLVIEPTHAEVVSGMVQGLREKKTEVQADAQALITQIDSKINDLLAITNNPTKQKSDFTDDDTRS